MRIALDIPPGLFSDDTSFAAAPRWWDGSNVRFRLGRPQVIGGWESLTTSLLTGVCRNVFNWTDTADVLNVAFGTHSDLQVWVDEVLSTITPLLAFPSVILGASPLSVVNLSAVVTVTHAGHGLITTNTIIVSGATAVGGITPNGGPFAVTRITDDSYSYIFTSAASSTASGGGSAVVIAPQVAFAAGAIDGTGGAGYGTGAYSTGTYSSPSTADYFPRTWALAAWGENLLANPRGGTIYSWANDVAARATPLANAPASVSHMLVASQDQVFALGCNEESSGVFNSLCIRHSGVRNNEQWATTDSGTSREYILPGGGRIVAGRLIGDRLLVWTSHSVFLGTFVGQIGQVWRFDRVGEKCGLIGPNAVIVVGQVAFWFGPDLQIYRYILGAAAEAIDCPILTAFAENLAASQGDKITASSNSTFSEIRFDYPDAREGYENSRYFAVGVSGTDAGDWFKGVMARTAFVDAGPSISPIGVTYAGNIYWHERGKSADGSPFDWFIESADQYFDINYNMRIKGCWPDIAEQVGPVSITLTSRFKPQGSETVAGPYMASPDDDKVDMRAEGRLFKVRFSGSSIPTYARLGKPVFEVVRTSQR